MAAHDNTNTWSTGDVDILAALYTRLHIRPPMRTRRSQPTRARPHAYCDTLIINTANEANHAIAATYHIVYSGDVSTGNNDNTVTTTTTHTHATTSDDYDYRY